MGVATDGQICYGIVFEEGTAFPWDAEQFKGDMDEWWMAVNGYQNPHPSPFSEDGNYRPGWDGKDPRTGLYFHHRSEWMKKHPLPAEMVNYCRGSCPMYMLAVPSSCLSNRRGYPETFNPEALRVTAEERKALLDFCKKHGIETEDEPKWWLSSYWG